jgi:predicted polyphosphate/ATP-dependent NAD kinase
MKTFIEIPTYPNFMAIVGFLINPIAGMGGKVGLKGTDGDEILKKARELGAEPVAQIRAEETLKMIFEMKAEVNWLTASGKMGEDVLRKVGYGDEDIEVVHKSSESTTKKDTESACEKFKEKDVDLILFCAGDGTARDIHNIINKEIPIIGIPSGVKMFSSVFGVNPKACAELFSGFIKGMYTTAEAEILDIDEDLYRKGELSSKLLGYALTPYESTLVQASKSVFSGEDEESAKAEIARYVVELMGEEKDTAFILGAGSTIEAIGKELGVDKTLLGIDVIKNGKLIAKDVNEGKLLEILGKEAKAMIIVGVIGAQGFVFGRGNQQVSPEVIRKVGVEKIRIVATPHKMSQTPVLRVDTGDGKLDELLAGFHKVIVGFHEMRVARVEIGGIRSDI